MPEIVEFSPPPAISNNGKQEPASSKWMRTAPFSKMPMAASPLLARGGIWVRGGRKTVSRVLVTRKCAGFGPQNLDFGLSEARLRRKCAPRWAGADSRHQGFSNMAKAVTIKVK